MNTDELRDLMWREVENRFADRHPEPGEDDVVVVFRPAGDHLGAVRVLVLEPGFIVDVEDWTHWHFDLYDAETNAAFTARSLENLFADRLVVWRSQGALMGGTFSRDKPPWGEGFPREPPADAELAVWTHSVDAP